MSDTRLSYEESCEEFKPDYISETPPLPDRMPRYDDEELGLSFFKTFVGDGADFSNLTIPRTFFGRSEIRDTSFRNTDLSESCLCWNDFADVDFSAADLSNADLRGSTYRNVNFRLATLKDADLRHSSFENCDFEGADLSNATLSRSQKKSLSLADHQVKAIDWRWRAGPLPDGG
ncbi:MAG: pentapeptide repeat-containing protein [Pseudomonadota bacterium]